MKKNLITVDTVKNKLNDFLGKDIKMQVNKGRNRLFRYNAKIINLYPSVFTVIIDGEKIKSYSYTEILCGVVKICLKDVGTVSSIQSD